MNFYTGRNACNWTERYEVILSMHDNNIVLIGMPGAGKTTVGMLLSKTLEMPFIDTDNIIREREGSSLQDILNEKGLKAFMEIEEAAVMSLDTTNHVIATGGSVVYSRNAMHHLKSRGKIIYLQLNYRNLDKRIKNMSTRGIARNESQTLLDIYKERVPLYKKYADITIHCAGKHKSRIVEEIIKKLS